MDSGANYRVTLDSENLNHVNPIGKSHLLTCTGERTRVSGIGFMTFPSSKLSLNEVFVVPSATKQLLSVNKLVTDNNVDVLFTKSGCTVKDLVTGRILMAGTTMQGMYPMTNGGGRSTQGTQVLSAAATSSYSCHRDFLWWHNKFGHPSLSVLKKVLSQCNAHV